MKVTCPSPNRQTGKLTQDILLIFMEKVDAKISLYNILELCIMYTRVLLK